MENNEQKSLNQIIDFRIKKIKEIKAENINPYPYKFNKELDINYIIENEESLKDSNIITAGRIVSLRSMGKAAFMNIQDFEEKIQLYIKNEIVSLDLYDKVVKKLDIGDIIGIAIDLDNNKLYFRKNII